MNATESSALDELFSDSSFNAHKFIREKCADLKQLYALRSQLQSLGEQTTDRMKKNVFHNYTQFIDTAREISHLEDEMCQLNHILVEQRKLIDSMQDLSFGSLKDIDENSSFAHSKAPKASHAESRQKSLQLLLEQVEGCAMLSENQPKSEYGRYVIFESDLAELHTDTLAVVRSIRLVLLNDYVLLVTPVQKRLGATKYKMDDIWQLDSLQIVDVPNDGRAKDVLKLLIFPQHKLFQVENLRLKRQWLDYFEQAKRQLLQEGALVRQATLRSRMSQRGNSTKGAAKRPSVSSKISASILQLKDPEDVEDIDYLREIPDEVDVCIAQRDFEGAAELLFEGKEILSECKEEAVKKEIEERLLDRERQLSDVLVADLIAMSGSGGGPKGARRAIGVLNQLELSAKACDIYLKQRSKFLKAAMSDLKILDIPVTYVHELNHLVFSTIVDVATEFSERLFPEKPECMAVLVVWTSGELRHYVEQIIRHVFDAGPSCSVFAQCLALIRKDAAVLRKLGLDLSFELNKLLSPSVVHVIEITTNSVLEAARLRIAEDQWRPSNHLNEASVQRYIENMRLEFNINVAPFVVEQCKLTLTSQTCGFARMILQFMADVQHVLKDDTVMSHHRLVAESIATVWSVQLDYLAESCRTQRAAEAVLADNLYFIEQQVLPRTCDPPLSIIKQKFAKIQWNRGAITCRSDTTAAMENLGDV